MKTFRWGILGCGGIAGKFADAVRFLPDAEVTAAASRTPGKGAQFAVAHGIPNVFEDYREMLESGLIDGVYIATVNSAHYDNMMLAIDCGIPILCEKPMLMTLREFDEVTKKAAAKKVPVMEAMWSAFIPATLKIRELLAQGAIGTPKYAAVNFCVGFDPNPKSRIFAPELGGGVVFDIGVYVLHASFRLFGDNYRDVAICGSKGETGVDVRSGILLTYPDGLLVSHVTADAEGPRDLTICGTEGRIISDSFSTSEEVILLQNGKDPVRFACPFDENGFEYEVLEFMEIVRSGRLESEILPIARSRKVCELMEKTAETVR